MNGKLWIRRLLWGGVVTGFIALFGWALLEINGIPKVYAEKGEVRVLREKIDKQYDRINEKMDKQHMIQVEKISEINRYLRGIP